MDWQDTLISCTLALVLLCGFCGIVSAPEQVREDLLGTTLGQIDALLTPILKDLEISQEDRAAFDTFAAMVKEVATKLGADVTDVEAERLFDWWVSVSDQLIKDCEQEQVKHPDPLKQLIINDLKNLHTHVRELHARGWNSENIAFLVPIFAISDGLPSNAVRSGLNMEVLLDIAQRQQELVRKHGNAVKSLMNAKSFIADKAKAVTIVASRTTNWLVAATGWSKDVCVLLVGLGGPYLGFTFSTVGAIAMDYNQWKRECTEDCTVATFAWETFYGRGAPYLPHMLLGALQALCMEYTMPYYCVLVAVLAKCCMRWKARGFGRSIAYIIARGLLLAIHGFRHAHMALFVLLFLGNTAMVFRVWLSVAWYQYGWAIPVVRQEKIKASVDALYLSLSTHTTLKALVLVALAALYLLRKSKDWCDYEKNSSDYMESTKRAAKRGSKHAPTGLVRAFLLDRFLGPLHWILRLQGFFWPLAVWAVPKLLGAEWLNSMVRGLEQVGELDFADGGIQYFVSLWNLISLGH